MRFRYRLVGTQAAATFGFDYTGKYQDEIFQGERHRLIRKFFLETIEERKPNLLRHKYRTRTGKDLIVTRCNMPLSDDGTSVNMILGILRFESPYAIDHTGEENPKAITTLQHTIVLLPHIEASTATPS